MTHIYVEHQKVLDGALAMKQHKSTFDEILSQLEADLAPMISTWSGQAQELYLAKKKQWDAAALDLTDLLGHISTITEQAHTGYVNAVNNVTDAWS